MATATELVQVNTRIEPDLQQRLAARAAVADRSVAAEIRQAIRAWVEAGDQSTETPRAAA